MNVPNELIYAAMGTLGSAIAFLFGLLKVSHDKLSKRADKCEIDRESMRQEIYQLRLEVEKSKLSCEHEDCPRRESFL